MDAPSWGSWCFSHCRNAFCQNCNTSSADGDEETHAMNKDGEGFSTYQTFVKRVIGQCAPNPESQRLWRSGNEHPEMFAASYDMKELIGCGSSSKCYRCVRRRDGKIFAVKVVNFSTLSNRYPNKTLQRLFREVRSLQVLNHEAIVEMVEFFSADNKLYIVEEYLRGGELYTLIIENHGLAEAPAREIFRQLAGAINHMHQKGIIHRDIKPENVLLLKSNALRVKIIDFGFSKTMKGVHARSFLGTGGFLAPEIRLITKGGKEESPMYTKSVDVWALGCLLFVLLCARLPFDDSLYVRPHSEFVVRFRPERTWRHVSQEAKDLIRKMLTPCAKRRITMGEVCAHPWVARSNINVAVAHVRAGELNRLGSSSSSSNNSSSNSSSSSSSSSNNNNNSAADVDSSSKISSDMDASVGSSASSDMHSDFNSGSFAARSSLERVDVTLSLSQLDNPVIDFSGNKNVGSKDTTERLRTCLLNNPAVSNMTSNGKGSPTPSPSSSTSLRGNSSGPQFWHRVDNV